jgi:RNA polymerase sigma-70 factor, ECF subfamily
LTEHEWLPILGASGEMTTGASSPAEARQHEIDLMSDSGGPGAAERRAGEESHTGFRCRTAIDDSPEALRQTQLAVARAREGDEAAFRFLYLRFSHNIYGYVRSIVRDDYEAEDVTQHVFAKLITALGKYDDRGVPFFAWLLRLARNAAIDHLRSHRPTPCEEVFGPDEHTHTATEVDEALTVRAALATLPEDQRAVVILRHVVGLSPGEIADQMGRTESSIHGLHHRGRRALQRELARSSMLPSTPAGRRRSAPRPADENAPRLARTHRPARRADSEPLALTATIEV